MNYATLVLAGAITLAAGAVEACDMHGDDFAPMTAYIDYRGMTEAQMRIADAKALEAAHEKAKEQAMSNARYALLNRFNIKVDDAPVIVEAEPAGDQEPDAASARIVKASYR